MASCASKNGNNDISLLLNVFRFIETKKRRKKWEHIMIQKPDKSPRKRKFSFACRV